MSNLPAGTIDNADVNASAAIAGTKIAPDFGSQNISTTGGLTVDTSTLVVDATNNRVGIGTNTPSVLLDLESTAPTIKLTDSDASGTPECKISGAGGDLLLSADKDDEKASTQIIGKIDGTTKLTIAENTTTIANNLDVGSGIDVTGNSTFSGPGVNTLQITGTGGHELYSYHDSGGNGWATGASSNYGELLYFNETGSAIHIYTNGIERLKCASDGTTLTGPLYGDKAEFRDDGTSSPTVKIATDDQSPWALQIRNDIYFNVQGNGAHLNWYFQQTNGGSTYNSMTMNSSGVVGLRYQNNEKLATSSTGVTVTGTVAATSYTGDGSNLTVTSNVENRALRVTSGTVGSGGSNAFTNTLASRGITANSGNATAGGNVSVANAAASGNISVSSVSTGGTVNNHTLSTNQIPSHSHNVLKKGSQHNCRGSGCLNPSGVQQGNANSTQGNQATGNTGGGGAHSHGFSGSSHNHNASFSGSNHTHNASFSGNAHNHSISVGNLDMAVQYIDVIVATKD